jgi:uncharacterized membrane protein YphA (DoxX/SURF4 family)
VNGDNPGRVLAPQAWPAAALLARITVGALFIYAATGKILDPLQFAEEIRAYELAPVLTTNAIAIVLPWLELFAGLLVVVGLWRAEARLLILVMLAGFTVGKLSVEARGMDIDCGCWSSDWMESTFRGVWGIVLNLSLAGLLLLDYGVQRRTATLARDAQPAA